jgi:MtN3 and saliva related transmembrane protein
MNFSIIGYIAGFLTTLSFVPQVLRAYRTRHCEDLSWAWLFVFQTGLGLWFLYGVILRNWPMILSNSITMSLCFGLMFMKSRYKPKQVKSAVLP